MKDEVIVLLSQVTKGAMRIYIELDRNRDVENNLSYYGLMQDLTRTQKETHSRRLRELRDVNLVRRVREPLLNPFTGKAFKVRRGTVILNPDLAGCVNTWEARMYWDQCKGAAA